MNYAILPSRVKAVIIDAIVIIAASYGISELLALFENVPAYVRVIAFVAIFIVYDPFFTCTYGGTLGHSYCNIMVKREDNPNRNIPFANAILRFIVKSLLGWLSLLTVTNNEQRKAIHDFVAKSIVLESES